MTKRRPQIERVTHKQIIKAVAARTKYREYEVEDVLHGLALVMQEELNNNRMLCLKGVGMFNLRISKPRTFTARFNGQTYTVEPKRGVALKPDVYMQNSINRESDELTKNAINREVDTEDKPE